MSVYECMRCGGILLGVLPSWSLHGCTLLHAALVLQQQNLLRDTFEFQHGGGEFKFTDLRRV